MKHRFSFIVTLWWVLLCALAGFFLLVTGSKHPRRSDAENRMLAGFPEVSPKSVVSGDFMTGFEDYLSDGFFDRDGVITFTERLLGGFSTLSEDERQAMRAEDMEGRLDAELIPSAADADTSAEPSGAEPFEEDADEIEENVEVAVADGEEPLTAEKSYIWLDKVDGSRNILYTYDNKNIRTYGEILKLIHSNLPSDGVICFTQVPLSSIANRWTTQQDVYCGWGSTIEKVLEAAVADTPGIYIFNTYDILKPYMTGDVPMFYATDHHWTAEGAYRVLCEMLRRQNLPIIPYEEYAYKAIRGKTDAEGRFDIFNALYPLMPGHSYVVTDVDRTKEIDLMDYDAISYMTFINGTQLPWRRIVTGANTGRRALVICDSFGNALTPYLLPYYDEVHMCDFRQSRYNKADAGGNISQMMQHYGISDVYVITSTANGLRKPNSLKYLPHFLTY